MCYLEHTKKVPLLTSINNYKNSKYNQEEYPFMLNKSLFKTVFWYLLQKQQWNEIKCPKDIERVNFINGNFEAFSKWIKVRLEIIYPFLSKCYI